LATLLTACTAARVGAEELLDVLLADYHTFGLQLPSKHAKLALVETASWGGRTDVLPTLVLPPTVDAVGVYRDAISKAKLPSDAKLTLVAPTPDVVKRIKRSADNVHPIMIWTHDLPLAIQCHCLGWTDLARALLDHDRRRCVGRGPPHDVRRARSALVDLAWEHCRRDLSTAGTDRREIARRMRTLLDANLDHPYWQRERAQCLYDDLHEALKASSAKPGSVEGLIDGLIELTDIHIHDDSGQFVRYHPVYDRLCTMGFRAVPALLEHAEDRRLTRYMMHTGMPRPPIARVGNLARMLLEGLAGRAECETWWTPDGDKQEEGFHPEKAEAWWQRAQAMGEEPYLLKHLYRPKHEGSGLIWPDPHKVHVLAARYPDRLLEEYERVVTEMPDCGTDGMVEALGRCEIDTERKVSAILKGAKSSKIKQRIVALVDLLAWDHPKAVPLLVDALHLIPTLSDEQYEYGDLEDLTDLVRSAADPRAWKALEHAAKASPVERRLEVFAPLGVVCPSHDHLEQRLAVLDFFLSDDEIVPPEITRGAIDRVLTRDTRKQVSEHLGVRDFAACSIARLLKLTGKPQPDWTQLQWSEFRAQAQEALSAKRAVLTTESGKQ
jgi:hypothetical protein